MVYKFFVKKASVEPLRLLINLQLKMKLFLIKNKKKHYTNQLLENLIKEKNTHLLTTIFGAQIY